MGNQLVCMGTSYSGCPVANHLAFNPETLARLPQDLLGALEMRPILPSHTCSGAEEEAFSPCVGKLRFKSNLLMMSS